MTRPRIQCPDCGDKIYLTYRIVVAGGAYQATPSDHGSRCKECAWAEADRKNREARKEG